MRSRSAGSKSQRRGAAAVELAILLPLLCFMFMATVDFARVFYFSIVVTNCARSGAVHASDVSQSPYASVREAVLADSGNLAPAPGVSVQETSSYVEVTVTHAFQTIAKYPGIPSEVVLRRTIRAQKSPLLPDL